MSASIVSEPLERWRKAQTVKDALRTLRASADLVALLGGKPEDDQGPAALVDGALATMEELFPELSGRPDNSSEPPRVTLLEQKLSFLGGMTLTEIGSVREELLPADSGSWFSFKGRVFSRLASIQDVRTGEMSVTVSEVTSIKLPK